MSGLVGPALGFARLEPVDRATDVTRAALSEVDRVAEGAERARTSRPDLGARLTRRFFLLCEHPRTRRRMLSAVGSSAGDAVAGRLLVGTVEALLTRSLGRARRVDDLALRVELVAAQLGGIAVLRYVTEVEPLASLPLEDLVARVAPAISATLTNATGRPADVARREPGS